MQEELCYNTITHGMIYFIIRTLQTPKMAICLNETTYHLKHNSVNRSFAFG